MTKCYDSKAGIEAALSSLTKLNELLAERRAAAYGDGERLEKFLILGRFYLDSCGNVGIAQEFVPKEHFPTIPDVLTEEELNAYLAEHAEDPGSIRMRYEMHAEIPDAELCCPECGSGWNVANCHDMIVYRGDEGGGYHGICNQAMLLRETATKFRETLELAGFSGFTMTPIPNGYFSSVYATPWFEVILSDCQKIVIGWRKRVINIDYSDTSCEDSIVGDDNTDNWPGSYAHAWGYEDAVRYLSSLRENIMEEEPVYAS